MISLFLAYWEILRPPTGARNDMAGDWPVRVLVIRPSTQPTHALAKPILMASLTFCWVEGQTPLDAGVGELPFNPTYA